MPSQDFRLAAQTVPGVDEGDDDGPELRSGFLKGHFDEEADPSSNAYMKGRARRTLFRRFSDRFFMGIVDRYDYMKILPTGPKGRDGKPTVSEDQLVAMLAVALFEKKWDQFWIYRGNQIDMDLTQNARWAIYRLGREFPQQMEQLNKDRAARGLGEVDVNWRLKPDPEPWMPGSIGRLHHAFRFAQATFKREWMWGRQKVEGAIKRGMGWKFDEASP